MHCKLLSYCSPPPPDDFEPSENQAMKKWKQVFIPPPRETQADEWGDIPPAMPGVGVQPGGGDGGVQMTGDYKLI